MDSVDKKKEKDYADTDGGAVKSFLHTSLSFLAENPETVGLVPDACPLVTDHLLIAANGYSSEGHEGVLMPETSGEGVDGLMKGYFKDIIKDSVENRAALRVALGNFRATPENLVSRYCAALAETLALQVLHEAGRGASYEQTCVLLSQALGDKLANLKSRLIKDKSLEDADSVFFSVSLGICRVLDGDEGHSTLEIYSAGGFRVYLLDENGMSPIWSKETAVISPDSPVVMEGKRIELVHPKPFAILLVSESIYDLSPAEYHTLQGSGGMIWRYRMRLEDQFLRLITDCVQDFEFGARATRFFSGRTQERKSATGALSVRLGDSSFEVFRNCCQARLAVLEKLIALLPGGYNPKTVRKLPERITVEVDYLKGLMARDPQLGDRMREALRHTVLDALRNGAPACEVLPPDGVPNYRRPDWELVRSVFAAFDGENDPDRMLMAENREMLRELLSEHWITLRPRFLSALCQDTEDGGARTYEACLSMSVKLSAMLLRRRNTVVCLENCLTDSLEILHSESGDWICGRAGMESVNAWMDQLNSALPDLLAHFRERWASDTEEYRCLHAAYSAERERLFRKDAEEGGFFAETWQTLWEGTLSDTDMDRLGEALDELEDAAAYRELWESVCRLSHGIKALLSRIHSRAAESRTAREISNRPEVCLDALRGAAYEDRAWGSAVLSVLDTATRTDFRSVVRRWLENSELARRQAEAYAEYSTAYSRYL